MNWLKRIAAIGLGTVLIYYIIMFVMGAIVTLGLAGSFMFD